MPKIPRKIINRFETGLFAMFLFVLSFTYFDTVASVMITDEDLKSLKHLPHLLKILPK